jgi:transposase
VSNFGVHGAQLKAQVIAACHAPGASVAAVALAHGLNANLVRKWLIGRGLKLAGAPLRFMPVELATRADAASATVAGASAPASGVEATIHIHACRGELQLDVRWPATRADVCATLPREWLALAR